MATYDRERYHSLDAPAKARKVDAQKARRRQIASKVWEYLLTHPCPCGESDPIVLQFDHLGNKVATISDMLRYGRSEAAIFKEIAKCQVLCANCHLRKTSEDFGWYTYLRVVD